MALIKQWQRVLAENYWKDNGASMHMRSIGSLSQLIADACAFDTGEAAKVDWQMSNRPEYP